MGIRAAAAGLASGLAACSLLVDLDSLRSSGTSDASSISPCDDAGTVIVCDDFDRDPLGLRWSNVVQVSSTLSIDDAQAVSAPNSLLITMPTNPDGATRQSMLTKTFTGSTLDCSFSIHIDATTASPTDDIRLWALSMTLPGFDSYDVWVELTQLDFILGESLHPKNSDAGCCTTLPFGGWVTGQWYRVHLSTDFQTLHVDLNGISKIDAPLLFSGADGGPGTIEIGQTLDTDPASWLFHIDDVICR